jgi:hypothetical protein
MTATDSNLRAIVAELANALQVTILIAQHLERASSTTAQDATAITWNLSRATTALRKLPGLDQVPLTQFTEEQNS